MKKRFILAWVLGLGVLLGTQRQALAAPQIDWQRTFGGTSNDMLHSFQQTSEGGWILGGASSSSTNGNKTSPFFGGSVFGGDFWVVRLDARGNKLWDRTFGGTDSDALYSLQQTSDGGFILGGYSKSGVSGNKTNANFGGEDFWVVRLDASGNKLWDRSYGGSDIDILFSLQQTSDGGFILGGYSASGMDGNKTSPNLGGGDFWVVRVDANGNRLWDRSFGGSGEDGIFSVQQTSDGGFILGGNSNSGIEGNKTNLNYGACDYWVVRIDSDGNKLWDRSFGGALDDGIYNVSIAETSDRGFLVGGDSYSSANGNKTSQNFGSSDFWVVRLAPNGNKLWDRSFGGTGDDYLTSLQQVSEGGFVLAGGSNSGTNGNKTSPNFGSVDFWVVGLDANGNKLWDQTFGGAGEDGFFNATVRQAGPCSLMVGGDSLSGQTGLKSSTNFGSYDFWVLTWFIGEPTRLRILPQSAEEIAMHGARFFVNGQSNCSQVVEYSPDLSAWFPLQTNLLMGTEIQVTDPGAMSAPRRLYRARRLP